MTYKDVITADNGIQEIKKARAQLGFLTQPCKERYNEPVQPCSYLLLSHDQISVQRRSVFLLSSPYKRFAQQKSRFLPHATAQDAESNAMTSVQLPSLNVEALF